MNKWQQIWNKRKDNLENVDVKNPRAVFAELIRLDGYDSAGITSELLSYFEHQYDYLKAALKCIGGGCIFEVGCGAGAWLYLFARDGYTIGGLDYSSALIDIAKKILPADKLSEIICAGADELPTDKKYDAVISTGVFSYFDDLAYAERVLEKMLDKSLRAVAVLDIYDKAFEDELLAERRRAIENYDERYRGLKKLFIPRTFFEEFAARHKLTVRFATNNRGGYVNAPYTYHCFMEKNYDELFCNGQRFIRDGTRFEFYDARRQSQ